MIKLRDLEGVTSVFVTHDLHAASTIATEYAAVDGNGRIEFKSEKDSVSHLNINFIMLQEGKVCFEGNYKELMDSKHPYIQQFVS